MKKIFWIHIVSFLFVSTSCDDGFLDRAPYDGMSSAVIWNSDVNAEMAINGMYRSFAQDVWYHHIYYYVTVLAPEGFTVVRNNNGLLHMTGKASERDPLFVNFYRDFYKPIRYANDAISGLADNGNVTPSEASRMIGEAKFHRGLCYFYLWQLFGGVPILEGRVPPSETYIERSTADEVRDLIIADFADAAERLPVSYPAAQSGKIERGAAIAMLGKVYLYDEQWDKAAEQFSKLMTTPFTYQLTENFDDHFYYQTQMNSESIFEVQYTGEPGLGSDIDTRYGFRNHYQIGQDYATASQICVEIYTNKDGSPIDKSDIPQRGDFASETTYGTALTDWYQTKFADADPRLHQSVILPGSTFFGVVNGVERDLKLYWPTGDNSMNPPGIRTTFPAEALIPIRKLVSPGFDAPIRRWAPVNFPLIRFADVLLMYAEAKNEASGPSADVTDAVNRVRERAGIVDLPSDLSKDELRREIRLERFRELLFETHGYLDVRRWRTAHTTDPIFGLNHDVVDFRYQKLFTKVFREDIDYLWPIPAGEIDLNPLITQNPGYR